MDTQTDARWFRLQALDGVARVFGGEPDDLCPGTAESLFGAGRVFQRLHRLDVTRKNRDGDHLGNLFARFELDGSIAEIGHEDEDFASVAGIDDSRCCGNTSRRHGGPVANQQAEGNAGGGMARLDGDAGADADGRARGERRGFEGKEIVAEVLAGVGDNGSAGGGVKQFYAKHGTILSQAVEGAIQEVCRPPKWSAPAGKGSPLGLSWWKAIRQKDL